MKDRLGGNARLAPDVVVIDQGPKTADRHRGDVGVIVGIRLLQWVWMKVPTLELPQNPQDNLPILRCPSRKIRQHH